MAIRECVDARRGCSEQAANTQHRDGAVAHAPIANRLADRAGTENHHVARVLFCESHEHFEVAPIRGCVIARGRPAHGRECRLIHNFGSGDPAAYDRVSVAVIHRAASFLPTAQATAKPSLLEGYAWMG